MTPATTLKRVVAMRAGGTPAVDDPSMWDEDGLPWVTIADMSSGLAVTGTARKVSSTGITSKSLPVGQPGTSLFAMYASVGAVGVLGVRASWNQAILGIEPRPGVADAAFIRYWLEHLKPNLGAIARSNTQDNLNAEQVGNLPFPMVSLRVQQAVAYYLDRETARIDALIAAKRRMVELLEEREGAMRSRLVSCSPDGTPYPRVRLKFLSPQIGVGVVVNPSSYFADQGVPFLHGSHITEAGIVFDPPKYMSALDSARLSASRLRVGDVVVVRAGYPGRAVTVPVEFDGANCASIIIVRKGRKIVSNFLAEFLNSADGSRQVALVQYGAAQEQINVSHIVDFLIPCPDLAEQRAALERVKRACMPLYEARQNLFRQVGLLQERRQALVTAAVTGQLDSPEVA